MCARGERRGAAAADARRLRILNLKYDVTPIEYVSMIATEAGYVPPTAAPVIIREFRRDANDEQGEGEGDLDEDGAVPVSDAVTQLQEEVARLHPLRFEYAGPQAGPHTCTAKFGARARARALVPGTVGASHARVARPQVACPRRRRHVNSGRPQR